MNRNYSNDTAGISGHRSAVELKRAAHASPKPFNYVQKKAQWSPALVHFVHTKEFPRNVLMLKRARADPKQLQNEVNSKRQVLAMERRTVCHKIHTVQLLRIDVRIPVEFLALEVDRDCSKAIPGIRETPLPIA